MPQRRRLSLGARTPMCSYFMRSPVDELGLMCDVSSDLGRVRRRTKPSYGSSYPADGAQAVILIGVTSRGNGAVSQTELREAKTTPLLNLRLCILGRTWSRMSLLDKFPIGRDGRDTSRPANQQTSRLANQQTSRLANQKFTRLLQFPCYVALQHRCVDTWSKRGTLL